MAEVPKGRGATEIVVFGRRVVTEALADPVLEPLELRVSRRVPGPQRHELSRSAQHRDIECVFGSDGDVASLSGEPRHDQGVALRVRLRSVMEIEGFVASLSGRGARTPKRVLALDGLTNSQNIGMILRSAVATDVAAVLWPLVGSPWLNGLVVKASAGTALRCPIVRCPTLVEGLAELQGAGFACLGLDARAAESLSEVEPPHRLAVVLGGETSGLSPEVQSLLDGTFSIPMAGGVESLNVAIAASLVCYQFFDPVGT